MIGQSWTTLLAQLLYDIPVNAGLWRPIHFDLGPQGTIVNSSAPAPVSMSHIQTGMRVSLVGLVANQPVKTPVFSSAAARSSARFAAVALT